MIERLKQLDWLGWFGGMWEAAWVGFAGAILALPIASVVGSFPFTSRQYLVIGGSGAATAFLKFMYSHARPSRIVATALAMPPGSTPDDLRDVLKRTGPGTVPTPEEAAAIVNGKP